MLIKDALFEAEQILLMNKCLYRAKQASGQSYKTEAEILLSNFLGISREGIFAHPEAEISSKNFKKFLIKCAGRARGKPLAYLTHHKEFFSFDFYVDERVLIPRPETETLVEAVVEKMFKISSKKPDEMDMFSVCDIGTGSGCIAISLAKAWPDIKITACDISSEALKVAKKNAKIHDVLDRVEFIKSDLMSAVSDRYFDFIVANLPYIAEDEKHLVDKEVLNYEPKEALFGGKTGLELFEKLFKQLSPLTPHSSTLVCEIGFNQRPAIKKLIKRYFGNVDVEWKKDLVGIDRVFVLNF